MILHYILVVYILFLGIPVGGVDRNQNRKLTATLLFSVFLIFSAFRAPEIGNDTSTYISGFTNLAMNTGINFDITEFEPGYILLNEVVALFSDHPQAIIITTSTIIIIGFAIFTYSYSDNMWLSIYLLFTLNYITSSMNIIRTTLAMIILMWSYKYMLERNKIKFFSLVIVASTFHTSAIIFIIAWYITKWQFNKRTITITVLITLLSFVFFKPLISLVFYILGDYSNYIGTTYLDGQVKIASIMSFLINTSILAFCATSFYNKKEKSIYEFKKGNQLLMLMLIGVSLSLISINFTLLNRVSDYFMIYSIIAIPYSLKLIQDKKKRILFLYLILVLTFVYTTTIFTLRPEWNRIYPYYFFWS